MTCELIALCCDANDPIRLGRFWGGVLGWETSDRREGGTVLLPNDDTGFRIRFLARRNEKSGQNRMHFDLTSTSVQDQQETVARALDLGARHIDVGQRADEPHVVLADPEDNEFCVIEPGNRFLADCGFIGALACDGSQEVGYFWNQALGWPLVWDQGQETAIRSPRGGPKITWGGPPLSPKRAGIGCISTSLRRALASRRRKWIDCSFSARPACTSTGATRAVRAPWSLPIPTTMSSAYWPADSPASGTPPRCCRHPTSAHGRVGVLACVRTGPRAWTVRLPSACAEWARTT